MPRRQIRTVSLSQELDRFVADEVASGLGVRETPFESSFCAKAILEEDFLLVRDATQDRRFDCNPLVMVNPTSASTLGRCSKRRMVFRSARCACSITAPSS